LQALCRTWSGLRQGRRGLDHKHVSGRGRGAALLLSNPLSRDVRPPSRFDDSEDSVERRLILVGRD
jgi:hypothetical protein